jgi:hypothetical protein
MAPAAERRAELTVLNRRLIGRGIRLGPLGAEASLHSNIRSAQKRRLRGFAAAACCLGFCLGFSLLAHPQTVPDNGPKVTLASVHPVQSSTVDFDVKYMGLVPWASIAQHSFIDVRVSPGNYRVEVDRTSMQTDPASHQFGFTVYVNQASLFQQSAYGYQFTEDCTGVFNDTIWPVNVSVGESRPPIRGSVLLPVHSPFGASNPYKPDGIVQKLNTGSQTVFTVTATSNLDKMGAHLGIPSASISCDPCLQTPIPVQLLGATDITPGGQLSVKVTANPNLWKAMSASSHPFSDKYDALLTITVPFTANEQGEYGATAINTATIQVPIKFSPSKPLLALCVIGGTLLGAFLRMLLVYLTKKSWDWTQFILGSVIAVVCWLAVLFAFWGGNSTIKLFGANFDPTQLFAAFMLCLVAGGGAALLKLIEEFIGGKP